ncbi:hypothetical protein NW762_004594 [Fusarium torreyae]|uniref:Uncharacterized protein n=1 Tax=Fusarium torreyae TaxID=1237075 RepID=A0A9W8VJM8_9HYPO|nr:hypothetical protein NW762_004594 [Fusarium torreyae]
MPEDSHGRDCHAFDATDASEIDPVTFRMNNPTMDWFFRSKINIDPMLSSKLLGRIVIGQIPDERSGEELSNFFERVRLPVKNTHPQQSCVTWVIDAIGALQQQGWAPAFNLDQFKEWALSYADERMKKSGSREPIVRYHGI